MSCESLLIELGCEEIPARMIPAASADLVSWYRNQEERAA